jgi:cobalamin biosynthetic protein CobC
MSRWTWHGGGLAAARARFGAADWLDLSTGINPRAWPIADDVAIDWRRLPEEDDLRALEAAAAHHFGAHPDHVCAVPGTEVGLRLVGAMLATREAVPARHLVPSYRTHAEFAPAIHAVAADRLAEADGATLILANPNNPDGRVIAPDALIALLERRGAGWLAVDEAFADALPGIGLAGELRDDRRLVLFRSFGKFFGLAGLRLGFVLGPRDLLRELRGKLGAWPVSAAAIAIGTRAYADRDWIDAARDFLRDEAEALDLVLADAGLAATGACPLFRLVETDDAGELFEKLASKAILTRPFADRPRWLRLGLPGDEHHLARLAEALRGG